MNERDDLTDRLRSELRGEAQASEGVWQEIVVRSQGTGLANAYRSRRWTAGVAAAVLVAVTGVGVWMVSAGGGDSPVGPAAISTANDGTGASTPGQLSMELPLASPSIPVNAAVHADAALVLSIGPTDRRSASFLTRSGEERRVRIPDGMMGAEPIAVDNGFAIVGFRCTKVVNGVEDACDEVAGSVAFYDLNGVLSALEEIPPVSGGDALSGYPDGGTGVLVSGPGRTWQVRPGNVGVLAERPLGALCGIPGHGVFSAEATSSDPSLPEDSLEFFSISELSPNSGEWEVIKALPATDDATAYPFCTPGGLIVEDSLFNGVDITSLNPDPGVQLDARSTIGVALNGAVLQRDPVGLPDGSSAPGPDGTNWVGLSADRATALSGGERWSFVDVS